MSTPAPDWRRQAEADLRRYPNGLVQGAPTDFYTSAEAERAIADAEAVIAVCRRVLSGS